MRATVIVSLALAGCSLLEVQRPTRPVTLDRPVACTDSRALPIADTVVTVGAAGLFGLAVHAWPGGSPGDFVALVALGLTSLTIGTIGAVSAHHGFSTVAACREAKREDRAVFAAAVSREQQRERVQERAWTQTKAAARAAREDDCATVVTLEAEVRELDAGFYRDVFIRDVAIARCLRSTAAHGR